MGTLQPKQQTLYGFPIVFVDQLPDPSTYPSPGFGSICWWCYWGWPKQIRDIYDRGVAVAGEMAMDYGPAHVVWSDENWDCAPGCLKDCDDPRYDEWPLEDLEAVRCSLRELIALPPELKEAPAGYDGRHPERFPPPASWVMVK